MMHHFVIPIITGLCAGLIARVLMIKTTYRQFPSQPHGMIIHLFIGFIASLIGSLAVPAILKPDFTAGVFFSIGAGQFHTMRTLERDTWLAIDKGEMVPRGSAYIEGMAAAYEARSFLVLAVALITTVVSHFVDWRVGIVVGIILGIVLRIWKQGKSLSDGATVKVVDVQLDGENLRVDGATVDHVCPEDADFVRQNARGVIVQAKTFSTVLTLSHGGQQQAILHNIAAIFGVVPHERCKARTLFIPKDGTVACVFYPIRYDIPLLQSTVEGTPLLESSYKRSLFPAR